MRASLVRYYERIGLLPPPERVSGQRCYDEMVLRRLAVIAVAQRAGLSLQEIGGLVHAGNKPISEQLSQLSGIALGSRHPRRFGHGNVDANRQTPNAGR